MRNRENPPQNRKNIFAAARKMPIFAAENKKHTAMRKLKIMMAAALVVAAPALFTSCDDDPWDEPWYYDEYGDDGPWWWTYDNGGWNWDDDTWNNGGNYNGGDSGQGSTVLDEAEVLEGEWDGTMAYTNGDNGEVSQFYANMTFVRNNSNAIKGTGTEVDYTLNGNNEVDDQQTLKFNWYIDEATGDIHIHYLTQSGSTFVMDASAGYRGFYLEENTTFEGYMLGTNNKDMIYINLRPVQNNEAKKMGTRASAIRSFGSGNIAPVNGGKEKLNVRR